MWQDKWWLRSSIHFTNLKKLNIQFQFYLSSTILWAPIYAFFTNGSTRYNLTAHSALGDDVFSDVMNWSSQPYYKIDPYWLWYNTKSQHLGHSQTWHSHRDNQHKWMQKTKFFWLYNKHVLLDLNKRASRKPQHKLCKTCQILCWQGGKTNFVFPKKIK